MMSFSSQQQSVFQNKQPHTNGFKYVVTFLQTIQHQTVRYEMVPLSPLSRLRIGEFFFYSSQLPVKKSGERSLDFAETRFVLYEQQLHIIIFFKIHSFSYIFANTFQVYYTLQCVCLNSPCAVSIIGSVNRKTLVLDLDETLIHSHHDGVMRQTVKPGTPPDFVLRVSF